MREKWEKDLADVTREFKKHSKNYLFHLEKQGVKRKQVGRFDIPLGFTDRNGNGELIKIRYDGKPKCMLVSGGNPSRGIGKSRMLELIGMDNFCMRFGVKTLMIDPKHELSTHTQPHTQFAQIFDKIGLKPQGVENLVTLTPSPLMKKGFDDQSIEYALDSSDLTYADLVTILNIDGSGGEAARSQLQMLLYGGNTKDIVNANWEELKEKKLPSINKLLQKAMEASSRAPMDSRLIRELINAKQRGALQPNKFESIPELMGEGKNVILQTSLQSDDKDMDTAAYISHALRSVAEDRVDYVNSGGKIGHISKPILCYIDEFNIPYPKDKHPSSKDIINKIYNQMRFAGVSIIAAAPSFLDIDPLAIRQSENIFTFRVTDIKERALLYRRVGKDEHKMRILERLNYNPNLHPRGECAWIDAMGNIETLYPLQPLSLPQYEETTFGKISEGFE